MTKMTKEIFDARKDVLDWVLELLKGYKQHTPTDTDFLRGYSKGLESAIETIEEKKQMDARWRGKANV